MRPFSALAALAAALGLLVALLIGWAILREQDPGEARCTPGAGTEPLYVFILAGQSNMEGLGRRDRIPEDAPYAPPDDQRVLVSAPPLPPTQWGILDLGYGLQNQALLDQVYPELSIVDLFGPEWTFGHSVSEALGPHVSVGLIKFAREGTSLANDWGAPDAPLYRELLNRVVAAVNAAGDRFAVQLQGVLWMQGESDAHPDHPGNRQGALARNYERNLVNFIDGLRAELFARGCTEDEGLPVVLGRIADSPALTFADAVRRAQWSVARDVPRVALVSTDALSLKDALHYDTPSLLQLGRLFASAALSATTLPGIFHLDSTYYRVDEDAYCSVIDPDLEKYAPVVSVIPWSLHYVGACPN